MTIPMAQPASHSPQPSPSQSPPPPPLWRPPPPPPPPPPPDDPPRRKRPGSSTRERVGVATPLARNTGSSGAGAALAGGWALGDDIEALPLRMFRLVMGGVVLIAGLAIGLGARGII